jgi:transcription-repair coupling factor (superfamily II helicase)
VKLLEQTILELKGEAAPEGPRATLNLRVDLRLPDEYVPEVHQRMTLYKRISQVRDEGEIQRLREEIRDRYGPLPVEAEGLLRYAALRARADSLGVLQADLGTSALHLRLSPQTPLGPERLVAVTRALPGATLSPEGVLRAPLSGPVDALAALEALFQRLEQAGTAA